MRLFRYVSKLDCNLLLVMIKAPLLTGSCPPGVFRWTYVTDVPPGPARWRGGGGAATCMERGGLAYFTWQRKEGNPSLTGRNPTGRKNLSGGFLKYGGLSGPFLQHEQEKNQMYDARLTITVAWYILKLTGTSFESRAPLPMVWFAAQEKAQGRADISSNEAT